MSNAHRMGRMLLSALVVLLLWAPAAHAATNVFWSSDVTQPRVGQAVTFFASGDGTTYAWNFGDGGTATGDTPSHSFSSPGTYTVRVTADGDVAYEQTMTVRGNWGPSSVDMYPQTYADDNPRVGQSANFSISAPDPEGAASLMTYTVNWGDGNTTTISDQTQFAAPISHTYTNPGTYAVHYSATDQDGSVTYPAQTIYGAPFRIKAENNPPPRFASFFADIGTPGVGETVTFTGSATDYDGGDIAAYAWDFGDGTTQSGPSDTRTHAFAQPGTYPVRMTVTDTDGGASATYEDVVYVHPAGSQVTGYLYASDFGSYYGAFARTGQAISFNAYAYNLPTGVTTTNYVFKWGDGSANTSTVNSFASHTYAAAGDYRPQVDISLSNGQTLHVYYSEYVDDGDDLYYSSNYTGSPLRVRANHRPLYGYAYLSNDSGCLHAGQSAAYTLYGYDSDTTTVASFDVDWNSDGTYDQLNIPAVDDTASVNHSYAAEGVYIITVRVKDGDGATYEDFRDVTQVAVTPDNCLPNASSTHRPDAPQTNKAIQFDASYSYDLDGTVVNYQWDWDNNGTYDSTGVSPTHSYATDGDHEYTLKVTDNQGGVGYEHGFVETHTGNHLPQFLSLYISQTAADTNDTVFFTASGYDDDGKIATYQWNWGDGNVSQTSSPAASHVYASPGTYHPIVTLVDDDGGTASSSPGHTYTITVTAAAPSAQVVWAPEEPHPGAAIAFTAHGSSPNGPLNQWTWHWGDGTADTVTSAPNASHAYAAAGNYNVTVTVRDTTNATGTGPAQTVGVKTNWAPHARFSVTPQCATSGTSMTFDGSATTDSDSVVTSYHWDFGDGKTADTPTPTTTHSYGADGTYSATLTAGDGAATSPPAEREITIQPDNCAPQDVYFTYAPSSLPSGSLITFTGHATDPDGTIVSYTWTWGDGTADTVSPTSGGADTTHTFAGPGVYFVQVVARDNQGAADKYIERLTVGVDTTAPVVTLTAPAGGALAAAKPTYSGAAGNDPSDAGTVTVKVYSGSSASGSPVQTLAASRTGTTWTITAGTALAAGTYTAQAQQSDGAGNVGFSAPHTFTIDPTPPSISLTTPADGASTNDTTPALSGTAGILAGDLAGVTVKIYTGTSVLGTLAQTLNATRNGTTGAYTVDASSALPEGTYTAQATQLDSAGNVGTSPAHTFTVDTTAPVVTLTAPSDGAATNDTTPAYSGAAGSAVGDGASVTVKIYAGATATGSPVQTLAATRSAASWATGGVTPLADGQYTAQASQADAAGNVGTSGTRTFVIDTTPPAVTLTAPVDGARTNDTTPTYSGAAGNASGDSASVTMNVYAGATATGSPVQTLVATRSGGTWTVDGAVALSPGTYTAQAVQSDSAGNTGTSPARTFVIDTTAPVISLTDPAGGTTVFTGTPSFAGVAGTGAGDGATVTVKVFQGAALVRTLTTTRDGATGAYSVPASPALPSGSYTAQAFQGDSAGNSGASGVNAFEVVEPPVVTLTMPADGAVLGDDTPDLAGARGTAASDLPTVTVKIYAGTSASGAPVQTLTDSGSGGTWTVTAGSLADGTYTAQATQTTGSATGTSAARTFRIDTTAPTVTITSPAGGSSTADATPALAGAAGAAAGDGATVTVKLYSGSAVAGSPVRTLTVNRAGGSWAATVSPALALGTYTAQAEQADSLAHTGTSAAVRFTIVAPPPANHPPSCAGASQTVPYGTATSVPLSCTDADGNALTLSIVGAPAHGTLGAVSGGSVRYTPDTRYSGPDQFSYKASDGKADSNVATAKLTVGAAPPDEIKKLLRLPPPGIVKAVLAGKKPASANFGDGVCPPACFIVIQLFPNGKTSGTTLGSKKFTVPEGRTVALKVKLSKSATHKLKKAGKLKCTAVIKSTDAAGQTTTVKVNYTLKRKR